MQIPRGSWTNAAGQKSKGTRLTRTDNHYIWRNSSRWPRSWTPRSIRDNSDYSQDVRMARTRRRRKKTTSGTEECALCTSVDLTLCRTSSRKDMLEHHRSVCHGIIPADANRQPIGGRRNLPMSGYPDGLALLARGLSQGTCRGESVTGHIKVWTTVNYHPRANAKERWKGEIKKALRIQLHDIRTIPTRTSCCPVYYLQYRIVPT